MKLKKILVSILLCMGLAFSSFAMTACRNNIPDNSGIDTPPGGIDLPEHTHTFGDYFISTESHFRKCTDPDCGHQESYPHNYGDWVTTKEPTIKKTGEKQKSCQTCGYTVTNTIPKQSPIYGWRYTDKLQNNMVVSTIPSDNNTSITYSQLVNRAIDSTADEIATRLQLVYGAPTTMDTYSTIDTLTGEPFVTFNTSDSFATMENSSLRGYDAEGNAVYNSGSYPLLDDNGNKIPYDASIHPTYVVINNEKYAALNHLSLNGNFANAGALRYFLGSYGTTIEYNSTSSYIDGILNFANAITGSGSWEYSENINIGTYYNFEYNSNSLTTAWNWATDYSTTAKTKLKQYIAYIASNKITRYQDLPSESVILASNYDTMIAGLDCINFAQSYYDVLYQVIANRIIGDAYTGDKEAGVTATEIAQAIYKTSTTVLSSQATTYYQDGIYRQLTELSSTASIYSFINLRGEVNFNTIDYLNARNYKGYDVVIGGLLNQIASNSAYTAISYDQYAEQYRNQYDLVALNNSADNATIFSTNQDTTYIYLFIKEKIDLSQYRLQLNLTNGTVLSIINEKDETIDFETDENGFIINYTLSSSIVPTSDFANTIKNYHYIKITLQGATDYQVYLTEQYVTNA